MTKQPDNPSPEEPTPSGGSAPISGQPWSTPSGDSLSPEPYRPPATYAPGHAPIPEPDPQHYPPTSQFPAVGPVNYAPPGSAPDYGAYPPHPAEQVQPGYGPPGYAPPGYPPPGYGPPGYGPPGYGPPRKSNVPIVAVILAVTLLLCGGLVTAGVLIARSVADKAKQALPTAAPTVPGLPTELPTGVPGGGNGTGGRKISVTYEISGDGPVAIVYFAKVGEAPVRLSDVKLPWKLTTEMETPALVSVSAVRLGTDTGSVGCKASVDGAEVKSNTSGESNFATVSCTHLALD